MNANLYVHLLVLHGYGDQGRAVRLQSRLRNWHVLLHDLSCLSLGDLLSKGCLLRHLSISRRLHNVHKLTKIMLLGHTIEHAC